MGAAARYSGARSLLGRPREIPFHAEPGHDNLCAASGGRDENSSAMAKVVSHARRIAETTDSVLVLVHHSRKSRAESSGDSGSDLRGHSSVEAALDLSLRVTRRDDNVVLRATKCRDQRLPDVEAIWRYTIGEDGSLQSGAFYRSSSLVHQQPKYRSVATEAPKMVRVIRTETGEWPNQSQLRREMREKLKVSDSVARSAIDEAVKAGSLEGEKTGTHSTSPVIYRLPTETMSLSDPIDGAKA